ncbi:MAG: protease HtpX [Gammaproteobacteria bacterium]
MKRIALFLMTNLAVLVLAGIVFSIFGPYVDSRGNLNLLTLLIFAAVIGFGGSIFSLMISKWMAKKSVGAQVITQPSHPTEVWLVDTVRRQAEKAGIAMPEVAIYDSPEINAFATGPSRNNSLVAVSTGLLNGMSRDEAEAVLGHEVSHVANGDMVTLTLIQGVVNTFVIFIARIVASIIDNFMRNDEGEGGLGMFGYIAVVFVLEMTLGLFASMITAWFSRQREYRADAGGAALAGREKMVAALERLKAAHEPSHLPQQMTAFGINTGSGGLAALFSTHPPLEQRIAALRGER